MFVLSDVAVNEGEDKERAFYRILEAGLGSGNDRTT